MPMLDAGVLQFDVTIGDKRANFARVEALLAAEAAKGALPRVLVLPELWSTGYALERIGELATPGGEAEAAFLGDLARKYGLWFVGGSVLASVPGGYANRAQVIDPEGRLVATYDKIHRIRLMEEDRYFLRGNARCRCDIDGVPSGIQICYDIRFPELSRRLALEGATVLFVSAEWPSLRIAHWSLLLRARAVENQLFVVACNRCGESRGTPFAGKSVILDPWGEPLWEAGGDETLGRAVLDLEKVKSFREGLPCFDDRAPDLY